MSRPFLLLLGVTLVSLLLPECATAQSLNRITTPPDLLDPRSVSAADLNGDGNKDVLVAATGRLVWYENQIDRNGSFSSQHVIADGLNSGLSARAADLDGDGDLDVLATAFYGSTIAWYENDGSGSFSLGQVISRRIGASSAQAADIDSDGDLDVVASFATALNTDKADVVWYKNNLDTSGTFSTVWPIATLPQSRYNRTVHTADLDGDGDSDILSAVAAYDSVDVHKLVWYENDSGTAVSFRAPQIISNISVHTITTADLDGDSDADVLVDAPDGLVWFENNLDAGSPFGARRVIAADAAVASIYTVDFDGDGDLDVGFGDAHNTKEPSVEWCENRLNSEGTFIRYTVTAKAIFARSVHAADLDGDGAPDLLSASTGDEKVAWYRNNLGRSGDFSSQRIINRPPELIYPSSVRADDLDGDGDPDVLFSSGGDDKIAWYENRLDAEGAFSSQKIISTQADGASSVYTADLDGDGDPDVLSASYFDDKIAWYENKLDTDGTFGDQQVISVAAIGAGEVVAADFDGDGDLDVLSASTASYIYDDDKIAWYENRLATEGTFGPQQVISTDFDAVFSIYAGDLDGDGDSDILAAVPRNDSNDDKIVWFENRLSTDGIFNNERIVSPDAKYISSIFAADLDGDGNRDVLSTSHNYEVAWYENKVDSNGTFGHQQIINSDVGNAYTVRVADMDGDGALDVIAGFNSDVAWFRNEISQTGSFGSPQIVTSEVTEAWSVFASDLDQDGDPDVLFTGQYTPSSLSNVRAGSAAATRLLTAKSASQAVAQIAWYRNNTIQPEEYLPVEHAQLSVEATENAVILTWTLPSGTSSEGFAIERSVNSTSAFQQVGHVVGKPSGSQHYEYVDEELPPAAETLTYRLCQTTANGTKKCSSTATATLPSSAEPLPEELALHGNFPNPFSGETTIRYALPQGAHVHLAIYNTLGQHVITLVNEQQTAGDKEVALDGSTLASGLYFVRLLVDGRMLVQRLTVIH